MDDSGRLDNVYGRTARVRRRRRETAAEATDDSAEGEDGMQVNIDPTAALNVAVTSVISGLIGGYARHRLIDRRLEEDD